MIKIRSYYKTFILLPLILVSLTGCFFNDAPKTEDESVFVVERLQDSCEINSEKLSNILTEDVSKEIDCVGAKLNQFAKYVRRSNPKYINKEEITRFIEKFFPQDATNLNNSLDLLFDVSHLILEDGKEVISLTNIQPLVLLFKSFNREAIYLHRILNSTDESIEDPDLCALSQGEDCYETFMRKRSQYKASIERLSRYVTNLLRGKKQEIDALDIIHFLKKANNTFRKNPSDDDPIDLDLVHSLLFVKRIFLGGSKDELQTNEVMLFLKKLPYFSTLLFDFRYGNKKVFKNSPNEQTRLFANHMNLLQTVIYSQFDSDEIVFTTQDLIDALNKVMTGQDSNPDTDTISDMFKDIDFNNFKSVLETLKGKIIGGDSLSYSSYDIQQFLHLGQDVLEGIYFNSIVYDYYQVRMEDPTPISEVVLPTTDELPQLAYIRSEKIDEHWKAFSYITKHYRYFGNSDDHIQHYQQSIVRSKYGVNEIFTLRWFSAKLLKAFGSRAPNGEYYGDKAQLEAALVALKPLLVELNFWPKRFETFAFNMITLSDLFQPQSNGDLHMGLDEMTEYFELVISTVNIHMKVQKAMLNYCEPLIVDGYEEDDPVFDPACYRENFFQVFFDDVGLEDKFTQLYQYYKSSTRYELKQFHKFVEEFARDNMTDAQGKPVLMFNRDRVLTIGALLNIESAYVNFDSRRIDNRLTYGELEDAFGLFDDIIITLAKLEGGSRKYARAVFYFMVDKMREPSKVEVLRYHYFADFEDITAYRMNIAAILSYFKKQSLKQ